MSKGGFDIPKDVNPIGNNFAHMPKDGEFFDIEPLKKKEPIPLRNSMPTDNNVVKKNVDNSSVVLNNQLVTDDQFFDDFFGDED